MAKAAGKGRLHALRRAVSTAGWWRLSVTALLLVGAVLAARYTWNVPLSSDAERALYDVRALAVTLRVDQDPRIVLVTYTDETLEATGKRSPLDRALLAKALAQIDRLGPKAIGIDILVDQPQPDDDALRTALRAMNAPTFLGFSSNRNNADAVLPWQEAFMRQFQANIATRSSKMASIRLEADADGVMRNWPGRPSGEPPLLTTAMVGRDDAYDTYTHAIAYRLPKRADSPVFASIPIDLFAMPEAAAAMRSTIAGRYVLIGGDITDTDRFDTPVTRLTGKTVPGLEVHASMMAQQLDGVRKLPLSPAALWTLAALVTLAAAVSGFSDLGGWGRLYLLIELLLIVGVPFALERVGIDTQSLPAFGWIAGWTLAYVAASGVARNIGSEQRRFAQSALGRYLPADVAQEILDDPERLTLTGERREIYALFSDLEGFTSLTDAVSAEMIAVLLNDYLERLSRVVLAHGGTIDKFVGDAVVAFWGAPIARPNDREMAVQAAFAMAVAGDEFSAATPAGVPRIGRTRVGVHHGAAIVGNFGGADRIQYTALGDAMNAASRLESANKKLQTRALVSEEAAPGGIVGDLRLRPMGRITVRGRAEPLAVYEAAPTASAADIVELSALLAAFDRGEEDAMARLEAYAAARAEDAALANLIYRSKQSGPGGFYAVG